MLRQGLLRAALALAALFGSVQTAEAHFWQCVPYARLISGVNLYGNAKTWWTQAAGKYDRGSTPREGAVLAFAASSRMPIGHVATVARVLGDREVLLNHANWSHRGGVETAARAVDVSPNNDWTMVKVWYGPLGGLGTSANPAKGFIYGARSMASAAIAAVKAHAPRIDGLAAVMAGIVGEDGKL